MANILHIKNGDTIKECTCYTTTEDATPLTISGGNYLELKNNQTICYIGLWPVDSDKQSNYSVTDLICVKDNIKYYLQTKVVNIFRVNIVQSGNQTINVACNGQNYTTSFDAQVGSFFTVTITPANGYNSGTPSISSGYVDSELTITATAATVKTYTATLAPFNKYQGIRFTAGGITTTANGAETYVNVQHGWNYTASTCQVPPFTFDDYGSLSSYSGTITSDITISGTSSPYNYDAGNEESTNKT